MEKHIHLHLYTGANKTAPAVKVEQPAQPAQYDCGCGGSHDEHLGFNKLKSQLRHEKGVTNAGGLAAVIGRKNLGAKEFAAKAVAGKAK